MRSAAIEATAIAGASVRGAGADAWKMVEPGRQHPLPAELGVAAYGQAVPVGRRAAGPHDPVDRGRSAQDLAAHPRLDLAAGTDRPGRIVVGVEPAGQHAAGGSRADDDVVE